ncbi:hypothetical protein ACLOJK_023066 [Asimina triloba]
MFKEKKATLDACKDEVFQTPYGGDDDDDDDDSMDITKIESLHTTTEDEQRRYKWDKVFGTPYGGDNDDDDDDDDDDDMDIAR